MTTATPDNSAPTGTVSISGTPRQNEMLTASSALADADGMGALAYQWQRDGKPINGATASTYLLAEADVDTHISVRVSYVDGKGHAESMVSDTTEAVGNVNDRPVQYIRVSGIALQGQTVHVDIVTLADPDGLGPLSFQWVRDDTPIAGATAANYLLTQADVGARIAVQVSYTDLHGTREIMQCSPTVPIVDIKAEHAPTGIVAIAGAAVVGAELTILPVVMDDDGHGIDHFQWFRNGTAITGANGWTYTLRDADIGASISVEDSFIDGLGLPEVMTSKATVPIAPAGTAVPVGQLFRGTNGADTLVGGDGDDVFVHNPGYDRIDGGDGIDTLVSTQPSQWFNIIRTGKELTVNDIDRGILGVDELVNVERIAFADISLAFDIDGSAGKGYRLYQAIFDRAPDPRGMGYWLEALDNGLSLGAMAQAFMDSNEFRAVYGANPSNTAFLGALYRQALHREPDPAGIDYWDHAITSGAVDKVEVLLQFSESIENQAQVIGSLLHGIKYLPWH